MTDEPKLPPAAAPIEPAPTPDERTLAMWSHFGPAIANWVFGGNGWLVALIIWLVKKESKFVSFHAIQELFLQIGVFVVSAICIVTGIFCCFPFFLVFPLWIGALVYAFVVGSKANNGEWAEYVVVGKIARDIVFKPSAPPPPASPGAQPPPA